MNHASRSPFCTKLLVVGLVVLCYSASSDRQGSMILAQDDDYTELDRIPAEPPAAPQRVVVGKLVRLNAAQDGNIGNGAIILANRVRATSENSVSVLLGRVKTFGQIVDKRVGEILQDYDLSAEERERLRLAVVADRVRATAEIDEVRSQLAANNDVQEVALLFRSADLSLRKRFLEDSFFLKVSRQMLKGKPQVPRASPSENRHRANVEAAVSDLGRRVRLSEQQRAQLNRLLLGETTAPKTIGNFDDIVVKYQFGQLSDDKIRGIFDEVQWPKVRQSLESFREFGPFLKQQGIVPDPRQPSNPPRYTVRNTDGN